MPWDISKQGILAVDFNLEVLRGNVSGHAMVSIFGHDEDLDSTKTTVAPSLSTTNIDQSALAGTVDVASTDANDTSDGSGLRTVLLTGLDASGIIQTETIIMNGQTEVTSANSYSAVNGLKAITVGAGNVNAGTLWAGNGTFTAGVPATRYFSMNPLFNKALTAYYVIPAAKTLFFRQLVLTVATANKDVDFFIEKSSDGSVWFTEAVFGMESGDFQSNIIDMPGLVAGTHVRIEGQSAAAGGVDCTAILSCQLVDD